LTRAPISRCNSMRPTAPISPPAARRKRPRAKPKRRNGAPKPSSNARRRETHGVWRGFPRRVSSPLWRKRGSRGGSGNRRRRSANGRRKPWRRRSAAQPGRGPRREEGSRGVAVPAVGTRQPCNAAVRGGPTGKADRQRTGAAAAQRMAFNARQTIIPGVPFAWKPRRKLQDQLTARGATSGALRHSQAAALIETAESRLTMGDTRRACCGASGASAHGGAFGLRARQGPMAVGFGGKLRCSSLYLILQTASFWRWPVHCRW
jgi:hypothetical protein